MGRISGLNCDIWLNGIRFGGDSAAFDLNTSQSSLSKPQLNKRAQVRHPGIADFESRIRIWAANRASLVDVANLPQRDQRVGLIIALGTSPGDPMFVGNAVCSEATWRREDDGALAGACSLMSDNDSDAGWFRLVFPVELELPVLSGVRRLSAPAPFPSFPVGLDLAIWSSEDISATQAADWAAWTRSVQW